MGLLGGQAVQGCDLHDAGQLRVLARVEVRRGDVAEQVVAKLRQALGGDEQEPLEAGRAVGLLLLRGGDRDAVRGLAGLAGVGAGVGGVAAGVAVPVALDGLLLGAVLAVGGAELRVQAREVAAVADGRVLVKLHADAVGVGDQDEGSDAVGRGQALDSGGVRDGDLDAQGK